MKKMTQKMFYSLLQARAQKYGFTLVDAGVAIREKRTGVCPVVAVARHLGIRGCGKLSHLDAAEKMGLNINFADHVADGADSAEFTHRARPARIRHALKKLLGIKDI